MATLRSWWRVKEPVSCFSHLLGVVLAVPGLLFLILRAHGDPWRTVGFTVYGMSLVLLYGASSLYHGIPLAPRHEDLLRRFDHLAIYLLIAGSYTPVCLVTLRRSWGWELFGVIWGLTAVGGALKLFVRHHPRWLTTVLYVGMGWLALVAIVPLVHALSLHALAWLFAGGLAYTLGAVIYATQVPDPFPAVFGFHEIFHLFVLAGSACHFVFMARYILPGA